MTASEAGPLGQVSRTDPEVTLEPGPAPGERAAVSPWLRRLLVITDALAVTAGWAIALGVSWPLGRGLYMPPSELALYLVAIVPVTLLLLALQRLYLARVCRLRSAELAGLARACALSGLVALPLARVVADEDLRLGRVVAGASCSFVLLVVTRGLYGAWLGASRARGRFTQPILLVGGNDEAASLERLLGDHPELGFQVIGVVGQPADRARWGERWMGEIGDAAAAVRASGANGVLIATSAVPPDQLNRLSRQFLRENIHVQMSSGLMGIAPRRLRSVPLAQEPMFYLERISLARWQILLKRMIDVVVGSVLLLLTAPILLLAAIAVKLEDGGPILFRQQRVGRDGKLFNVRKLRTMVPDAEHKVIDLRADNQRTGGPLFKIASDPRRTRMGRLLEAVSLDELPQLVNVVVGEMSLVGPRPALPLEVASFDEELIQARRSVPPGLTGLWQVEARDNPAFEAYRRLDVYYVENWSVTLDLAIMLATVQAVFGRLFKGVAHGKLEAEGEAAS